MAVELSPLGQNALHRFLQVEDLLAHVARYHRLNHLVSRTFCKAENIRLEKLWERALERPLASFCRQVAHSVAHTNMPITQKFRLFYIYSIEADNTIKKKDILEGNFDHIDQRIYEKSLSKVWCIIRRQLRYPEPLPSLIEEIRNEMAQMSDKEIPSVRIQSSGLSVIPDELWQLQIKDIDLSGNSIRYISPAIRNNRVLSSLNLNANHHPIALPETLSEIPSLKSLNLMNNAYPELPPIVYQLKLRSLSCANNKIGFLNESLKEIQTLQYLNASHNLIKTIPDGICLLDQLRWLDLSDNTQLSNLPRSFESIVKQLVVFDFGGTRLRSWKLRCRFSRNWQPLTQLFGVS